MRTAQLPTVGFLLAALLAHPAVAAAPYGFLDAAGDGIVGGWARDDDFDGPIPVEIHIDGSLFHSGLADRFRGDVGSHAFQFLHPAFGPGVHTAAVYALGVDSQGQPDGERVELGGSPRHWQEPADREFWLTSLDGQVRVAFDRKFGGAITKIYDDANMADLCLVNWEQAGAMFQPAFWLLPRHSQLPPGCNDQPDMWFENPTLAGFIADGSRGNPIGIMGTDQSAPDPAEFIRYEDQGRTVHFRSRFIRYDYCLSGSASMANADLWKTDFYLEQWASFLPIAGRTLRLRSRITFVGTEPRSMNSRQLPIIFAFHLPRIAYWKDGAKVVLDQSGPEFGIQPDRNWAALIAADAETGIGMVLPATARSMPMTGGNMFGVGRIGSGQAGEPLSIIYAGAGLLDLRTLGTLCHVELDPEHPASAFRFHPGGTFEWITYYPIGSLDMIKATAEILDRQVVIVDFDYDGDVDQTDFGHLQACLTGDTIPQQELNCLDSRLDADNDVDADDVALFLNCLRGANLPPDPYCLSP